MSTKKLQVIGLKYSGGPGNDGKDGFSPIATVTQTETGATISIEDANGITTVIIEHGKDGDKGEKGDTGEQGPQGEKGDKGDKGETGANGKDGSDYVLTDSDKEEIADIVEERVASYDEVYVGSGDMPEGCTLQIDPEAEADEMIDEYAREQIVSLTKDIANKENTGVAETKVNEHNVSDTAHNDIRLLVQGLITRLNALADSDDTTLDQVSEIVAYIKSNKTLIDSITTSKVNVADIIDNLTTSASNKPLSAKQGVALKALIDAITVPTKTSQLTNDSNYQSYTQVQTQIDTALAGLELPSGGDGEEWEVVYKNSFDNITSVTEQVEGLEEYNHFIIGLRVEYDTTLEGQTYAGQINELTVGGLRSLYYYNISANDANYFFKEVLTTLDVIGNVETLNNNNAILFKRESVKSSNLAILSKNFINDTLNNIDAPTGSVTYNHIEKTILCTKSRTSDLKIIFSGEMYKTYIAIYGMK